MSDTIHHNKLVRDRILELLQERGIVCSHKILEGDAFVKALYKRQTSSFDETSHGQEIKVSSEKNSLSLPLGGPEAYRGDAPQQYSGSL